MTANADTSVQRMKALLLRNVDADYVVLNRRDPRSGRRGDLHYAFRRDEIEGLGGPADATLIDALNLQESGRSQTGRASRTALASCRASQTIKDQRRGAASWSRTARCRWAVVDDNIRRVGITELAARGADGGAVVRYAAPAKDAR